MPPKFKNLAQPSRACLEMIRSDMIQGAFLLKCLPLGGGFIFFA